MLKRAALVAVVLLTAGCGSAEKAGDSTPAGSHLVYKKVVGERGIWIANVDGSHPKLLVAEEDDHQILSPEISPDGTQVAYLGDCGSSHCTNARADALDERALRSRRDDGQRFLGLLERDRALRALNRVGPTKGLQPNFP